MNALVIGAPRLNYNASWPSVVHHLEWPSNHARTSINLPRVGYLYVHSLIVMAGMIFPYSFVIIDFLSHGFVWNLIMNG